MLQQEKKAELIVFTYSKDLPVFWQLFENYFEDQLITMVHFYVLSHLPSKC